MNYASTQNNVIGFADKCGHFFRWYISNYTVQRKMRTHFHATKLLRLAMLIHILLPVLSNAALLAGGHACNSEFEAYNEYTCIGGHKNKLNSIKTVASKKIAKWTAPCI